MPILDWQCLECGATVLDRYEPRIEPTVPLCPNSQYTPEGHRDPAHKMERLWTTSHSHKPFEPFTVEVDGAVRQFNSLSEVRNYERLSVERGSPSIFRAFSQNSSNQKDNVFGEQKFDRPVTRNRRGRPFIVRKS